MATFRGFSKDGTETWAITSDSFLNGQIDYLGNGYIIGNSTTAITLYQMGVKAGVTEVEFIDTLFTWAGSTNGFGIAVNHSRQDFDEDWQEGEGGYDGKQHYVGRQFGIDAIAYDIQLRDHSIPGSSRFIHQLKNLGSTIMRCCTWDGHYLFAQASGESNAVRQIDVGNVNNVGRTVKLYSTGFTFEDMCFDGQAPWCITGTGGIIGKFALNRWNAASYSFSHGRTNPRGLTTDGHQLIVLSS